jgi:tetratricopeptide (TPR) repeat protein
MKTYLFKLFLSIIFITCSFTVIAQNDSLYIVHIDSLKQALPAAPNDTNKVETYFEVAYFYQWSNPDSALVYAMPGLALARKLDSKTGEYDMLLPVVEALSTKGNYSKALQYRFRSLELANQLKHATKIANTLALIGLIYFRSKDYNKALEYYYKAQKTNAVTLGGPQLLNGFIGELTFICLMWILL